MGWRCAESAPGSRLADARARGQVRVALAARVGAADFAELAHATVTRNGYMLPSDTPVGARASGRPVRLETNSAASPEHPLNGLHVTFTGGLAAMPRQVAWDLLACLGGIPEAYMNKKTNILVMGPDYYTRTGTHRGPAHRQDGPRGGPSRQAGPGTGPNL